MMSIQGFGFMPQGMGSHFSTGGSAVSVCPCNSTSLSGPQAQPEQQQQFQLLQIMAQMIQMLGGLLGGAGAGPTANFSNAVGGPAGLSTAMASAAPGGSFASAFATGPGAFASAGVNGQGAFASAGTGGASSGTVERTGKPIGAQISQQFDAMASAAANDGVQLKVNSGKRSYQEQVGLYNKYGPGRAAKPGKSNHESGNAIDFANSPGAWDWLKRNASRFGFYNNIPHEPWHYSTTGK